MSKRLAALFFVLAVLAMFVPLHSTKIVTAAASGGYPYITRRFQISYADAFIGVLFYGDPDSSSSDYTDWGVGQNIVVGNTRDLGNPYPDNRGFQCIQNHVADSSNRPLTGANWRSYWAPNQRGWAMPCAGTWAHLLVEFDAAPVGDDTAKIVLYKEDIATDLYLDFNSASPTQQSNLTAEIHVNAGDEIYVAIIAEHGVFEASTGMMRFAMIFTPDTLGEMPWFCNMNADSNGTGNVWGCLNGQGTRYEGFPGAAEIDTQEHMPLAGTFKWARTVVCQANAFGGGATGTVVLRKNSANTTIEMVLDTSDRWLEVVDSTHEVAVVVGDLVNWQIHSIGIGTQIVHVSVVFAPDDTTQFYLSRPFGDDDVSNNEYSSVSAISGLGTTWFAVEYPSLGVAGNYINGLSVKLSAAPGVGKSRTFTLFLNGASSGIAVTISGLDTYGTVGGTVATTDFDDLSIKHVVSGSPAACKTSIALWGLIYIPPTVVTIAADNITGMSARVGGRVTNVGIPMVDCDEWGIEYGTATGVYTDNWVDTGAIGAGTTFTTILTGLLFETVYYYRAFAHNPFSGYGYGSEESFTSMSECPEDFTAYPNGCGRIDLYWYDPNDPASFPTGSIVIRHSIYDYPDTPPSTADFSEEIYDQPVKTGDCIFSDTGLLNGQTYYYRLWVYNETTDAYKLCAQDFATTYPCGPEPDTPIPPEWYQDPQCDMYYQTVLWPAMNYAIGAFEVPDAYFCMFTTFFLIGACCVSSLPVATIGATVSPKSLAMPFILGCALIVVTAAAHALPLGIAIVSFVLIGGIGILVWKKL